MIAQFAVRLICGMSLTWMLMPRGAVTSGFFRIQTLVTLGLSVLAAVGLGTPARSDGTSAWLPTACAVALAVTVAVLSYAASVVWMLGRRRSGEVTLTLIAICSALLLLGTTIAGDVWWAVSFSALSEISAAWLLGSALTAMLLGHWYLTATGMPLEPLKRLTQLLGAAVVVRTALAAAGLCSLSDHDVSRIEPVWLFLRWTAGCVAPLIMVLLVWRILRYRNTQSATGVLFAAVILIFIGETAAVLLTRQLDWPV